MGGLREKLTASRSFLPPSCDGMDEAERSDLEHLRTSTRVTKHRQARPCVNPTHATLSCLRKISPRFSPKKRLIGYFKVLPGSGRFLKFILFLFLKKVSARFLLPSNEHPKPYRESEHHPGGDRTSAPPPRCAVLRLPSIPSLFPPSHHLHLHPAPFFSPLRLPAPEIDALQSRGSAERKEK